MSISEEPVAQADQPQAMMEETTIQPSAIEENTVAPEAVEIQTPPAAAAQGMRKNGKQWHEPKAAFRPKAGNSTFEKRQEIKKAMDAVKAKEKEMKEEKENARVERIQKIKDKRAKKEEQAKYEKLAETMHRKRVERLKRREKRNKMLKSWGKWEYIPTYVREFSMWVGGNWHLRGSTAAL